MCRRERGENVETSQKGERSSEGAAGSLVGSCGGNGQSGEEV